METTAFASPLLSCPLSFPGESNVLKSAQIWQLQHKMANFCSPKNFSPPLPPPQKKELMLAPLLYACLLLDGMLLIFGIAQWSNFCTLYVYLLILCTLLSAFHLSYECKKYSLTFSVCFHVFYTYSMNALMNCNELTSSHIMFTWGGTHMKMGYGYVPSLRPLFHTLLTVP